MKGLEFLGDLAIYAASILDPPPRLTVLQWAERERHLSREYCASPGRYRSSVAPYQREPQDAVHDDGVQSIAIMCASQMMKTVILENIVGYFVDAEPAPILMVQPTVEMAEAWSKERLATTIRDTPSLASKVKDPRSRDSGNTVLTKSYPGGSIAIVGANAPSGLAMRPRRVVLLDEVDRYPQSAGTEGDPCALAIRRTESFFNAVVIFTSTPTSKGASRIEAEFQQTDQRRWFCPCPHCGEFQTMQWAQVKWPEGKPEDAWYECEKCQKQIDDAGRIKMVRAGQWRATAPFNGKRGYHINGICSPFRHKRGFKNRLHQMVADFLAAKHGGAETLKTWTNTFLAESWEGEAEGIDPASLITRLEDYPATGLPEGVLVLVASADVQKDRIESEIVGYGTDEESWAIERGNFIGNPEQTDVWRRFADFIFRKFDHPNGHQLQPAITFIDSGYATKSVLQFVKQCSPRLVYAVRGSISRLRAPVEAPKRLSRSRALLVDTAEFKSVIYARLKIDAPGPRYLHFPRGRGYDDEFFAQLTAEKVRTRYLHGHPKQVWENVRANRRNEALDIRVYNHAALHLLRPNWPALAKNLAKRAQEALISPANEESKPSGGKAGAGQAPRPASRAIPRRAGRSSFVGAWNKY